MALADVMSVVESLTHKNKTPTRIHPPLQAVYSEDTLHISTVHRWVRKSRDSGGNLYLNEQPFSGRPVATK
jgi:transposase